MTSKDRKIERARIADEKKQAHNYVNELAEMWDFNKDKGYKDE